MPRFAVRCPKCRGEFVHEAAEPPSRIDCALCGKPMTLPRPPASPAPPPAPTPAGEAAPKPTRPARRRRLFRAETFAALLALLVIGGIGAGLYFGGVSAERVPPSVSAEPPTPAAGPAAGALPPPAPPLQPPREEVAVLDEPLPPAAEPVLLLRRDPVSEPPADEFQEAVLAREILRQAVLLTAREEFGLSTRDEVLGEPAGEGPEHVTLTPDVESDPPQYFRLSLRIRREGKLWELGRWQTGEPPPPARPGSTFGVQLREVPYRRLAAQMAAAGAADIPAMLRKAGFRPRPNRWVPDLALPQEIEKRLGEMTFTEQFAALRLAHALARDRGESPAVLGALVRGYANLGLLTEHHLSPAHKVFKARALLYAERLRARQDGPQAARLAAYAYALAGLFPQAREELEQARAKAAALPEADRPDEPAWLSLLAAYLDRDAAALAGRAGDERLGQLAGLLHFLAIESPTAAQYTLRTGRELLVRVPECYRVHDALCTFREVSNQHRATTFAPTVFAAALPRRLREMPGLPPAVAEQIGTEGEQLKVMSMLAEVGKPGRDEREPSWAVLAGLIRETHFDHARRRLEFMRDIWAVPVEGEFPHWWALASEHPWRGFIEYFEYSPARQARDCLDRLRQVPVADLQPTAAGFCRHYARVDPSGHTPLSSRLLAYLDGTEWDLKAVVRSAQGSPIDFAHRLLQLDPNSPDAWALLIRWRDDQARPRLKELAGRDDLHPAVHAALGEHFARIGETEPAARHLRRALDRSPDQDTYLRLAELHLKQGDEAKWLATLEEYLEGEDQGLSQDSVRVQIARHFMARKEYDKAQPYADEAAESWAGWAMLCAGECAELRGDWDKSELWARRVSERYPNDVYEWYFWCARTGRGDRAAALQLVEDVLRQVGPDPGVHHVLGYGFVLLAEGKRAEAARHLAAGGRGPSASPLLLFYAAALAHREKDEKTRDEILRELTKVEPRRAPLTEMLLDSLTPGRRLDLGAVEKYLRRERESASLCPAVAIWLEAEGRDQEAVELLRRCAADPTLHRYFAWLARFLLREKGVKETEEPQAPPEPPAKPKE